MKANVDANLETRGLRRKTKWQSGKGGNAGCDGAVIKHFPHPFAFEGFWETVPVIYASPNSPQQQGGPIPGLSHNCVPYRRFISAICYGPPNFRRLLRQSLWLSNDYCTTITLVFFSVICFLQYFLLWLGDNVSITSRFLTAFGIFLQLTAVSNPGTT